MTSRFEPAVPSPSTNKEDFIVYTHDIQGIAVEQSRHPTHWQAFNHVSQLRCELFHPSLVYRNNETGERITLIHP